MSLPLVIISNESQRPQALAFILWDNAFSDIVRAPFEEVEHVPWSKLAEILNMVFYSQIGRRLSDDHLNFLCKYCN